VTSHQLILFLAIPPRASHLAFATTGCQGKVAPVRYHSVGALRHYGRVFRKPVRKRVNRADWGRVRDHSPAAKQSGSVAALYFGNKKRSWYLRLAFAEIR
jgi:hypothetical protein